MLKKTMWILLASLLVAALVLSSCQPATTTEEEEGTTVTGKVTEQEGPAVEEEEEEEEEGPAAKPTGPQYGGEIKICLAQDVLGFDELTTVPWMAFTLRLTNSELLQGNWARGRAGTGETSWELPNWPVNPDWMTGQLAESWEMPDLTTYVFHLREGVHFSLNQASEASKLVGGREVVAQDYVYSAERLTDTPGFYYNITFGNEANRPTFTATDKYTLRMDLPSEDRAYLIEHFGDKVCVVPHEVVETYGNMKDWKNSVGSGPFMLIDYLPGSSIRFARNPNYFMNDPLNPGNQLPYVDFVQMLVITDNSTRLAAIRTGKVDQYYAVTWEDFESLIAGTPHLKYQRSLSRNGTKISMRCDKEPFDDIRVRQAMCMAVDQPAIKEHYYGGNAELLTYVVAPLPDFSAMYTPLDEHSESVQMAFGHNPEEAKKLLAEAGYPDGFKTSVLCYDGYEDMLSIVQANLADIGVDLELDLKEYSVYNSVLQGREFNQMAVSAANWATHGAPGFRLGCDRWPYIENYHLAQDPHSNEVYDLLLSTYLDTAERQRIMKEYNVYRLEKFWEINVPTAYSYAVWQPWLKGYNGEYSVGFWNQFAWSMYLWVDEDLRKEIIGK